MNPRLDSLHAYPFEKLRILLQGRRQNPDLAPINLGIGEPQHATPEVIRLALSENLAALGKYPPTAGTPELRRAISDWHSRRYGLAIDPDRQVLPVAGTREALFALAQALLDPADPGVVLLPNPFYQIYEGAAILAGAIPGYVATPKENGFLPDWSSVPAETWPDVRLVYVCSPGNPAGAVFGLSEWKQIFDLADRYGFVIAADECYSEIYTSDPPIGALEAAKALGRDATGIVAFNSLSKRSSAPGLRSGFVAGDPELIRRFLLYRTYHGAAPSLLTQLVSTAAWSDEEHVVESRALYQRKFEAAREALPGVNIPAGGFFLWLPVEDDEESVIRLYEKGSLTVLAGRYLARETNQGDPGRGYLRVAMVPDIAECRAAIDRLQYMLSHLNN